MKLKLFSLFILLLLTLLLAACGQGVEETVYDDPDKVAEGESRSIKYEDDKMVGETGPPDKENKILHVGITYWEHRHSKGDTMTDIGIGYAASYTDETVVRHEDGKAASLDEIKFGQTVQINPPRGDSFEGHADEIILLDMAYEEKYRRLLSHNDGLKIVIMYEYGQRMPEEMQEPLFEKANDILEDIGQEANASWHEYNKDFVVDFKEELEIEKFPAIFVFDRKDMLFKAYNVEDVYEFLRNMEE